MSSNTLFNQPLMKKYTKKYKKELSLTHSKKEDVINWIKKLEKGELKDEVANYGSFSRIILEKILGYDYEENIIENVKEDYGRGLSEFALKKDNKNFMVIELKGSDSDLDKPQNRKNDKRTPVDQAFDYAKKSGDINWIFVSNYNEFRLYNWHKKQHQYISFKAEDLKDPETFKQFMLVFSSFSTIENNLIDKLVSKTIFVERDLEDEFYKLYNETRLMLIAEIEHLNPEFTREQSVHYSQLILNRYIFICFAEDLGLLPGEISVESIENPVKNNNLGRSEIWHRLNSLFIDVNEGNDFKKIYGYNGGLFNEDLEFLKIRDIVEDHSIFSDAYQKWKFEEYSLLVDEKLSPYSSKINPIYKNLMTISTFNFSSEVDVNILGHIFENSIGDIEELKADTKGRRKKDGIFYTPEPITDYICQNTIIPYLSKSGKSNTVKDLIGEYWGSDLKELDDKLGKIKIIDPACGSGAFLNKAGDILLEIHKAIHEKKYLDKMDTLAPYFDNIEMRREILLNNIYGVDLNEESVEITKLSLFLKVCKAGLKLPNLNKNIKNGNSLIDDSSFANNSFNWEEEFKEIFEDGGFDIVIGNPPYVRNTDLLSEDKDFFKSYYISAYKQYDLYALFFELGLRILKNDGYLGFITSNKFLATDYGKKLRNLLLQDSKINALIDVSYLKIFKDASTYPVIALLQKELNNLKRENNNVAFHKIENIADLNQNHDIKTVKQSEFNYGENNRFLDISSPEFKIIKKIDADSVKLKETFNCQRGSPKNKIKLINEKSDLSVACILSTSINRYTYTISDDIFVISNLQDKILSKEKILLPRTVLTIKAAYEAGGNFIMDRIYYLISKNNDINLKYATLILNSKIIDFYYKINFSTTHIGGGYLDLKGTQIDELPIKIISKDNELQFVEKADKMLKINKELIDEINGFKNWLKTTYQIDKLSQKLDKYYDLSFDDFLIELKKKKVDIKPRKTQELLKNEFEESLIKINPLTDEIRIIDSEINQLVYELYGLTDNEIQIIEDSINS